MNWYHLIRPVLFFLPPETAHHFVLKSLQTLYKCKLLKPKRYDHHGVKVFGIQFPNRVGLAAGFDRNGEYIDALGALGFGFIEVGTVTPNAQAGKPKPRIFRLSKDKALINRVGFANKGVDHLLAQLKKTHYRGVLGINIGKDPQTPNEQAVNDYLYCMEKIYPYANYISINISSPNTENLRALQKSDVLYDLLSQLKSKQLLLTGKFHRYVPILVKLAPDLSQEELLAAIPVLEDCKIDGVILTNSTSQRLLPLHSKHANETGGLSGKPLNNQSLETLKLFRAHDQDLPIIALGGICDEESAKERIENGASLVQIYTALIYQGPALIKQLATQTK